MATKKDQKLMTEFPPVSTEKWEEVINADLKGADYDRKLVWHTREGFNVRPYYRAEDLKNIGHIDAAIGQFPYVRSTGTCNHWKIHQTITVHDPAQANAEALRAIAGGAEAIGFRIKIKEPKLADIDSMMAGIDPTRIEVTFSGRMVNVVADLVLEHCEKSGYNPEQTRINVIYDPIVARLTLRGAFRCSEDGKPRFMEIKELLDRAKGWKKIRFVGVTGSNFGNAGATIVQELAFTLAAGHEYIAQLVEAGADVDTAARNLRFIMGVSSNYFMEIAKFRAARMLWATIMQQYETKCECSSKMRIHAVTSKWNMTVYDPYVNMLRGTTEAMSAAIGGVHSLEVLPFNVLYEEASEFSSRIARNVQLLLKHESHFDNVVDPSGGSYYIETLTRNIAQQAWAIFKEIEDRGGYIKAFQAGYIQHLLSEETAKKSLDVSTRKITLLGTNQYPNFGEKASGAVQTEMVKRGQCGCGCDDCTNDLNCECECGECNCGCNCPGIVERIHLWRGAQPTEEMRLKVDRSGRDVKVFLLTCGTLNMARARAQFAANFFGVAGFRIIDNTFFNSVEEGVEAANKAQADIVVMCSADDDYATLAPEAYKLLDPHTIFVVAGAPKSQPELDEQGIHNFISVKSNVLVTLMQYVKLLGI
ncbi:acyl-CoA mutase large subunit family protein [Alistipes sp. OttesenSCG-928-B03]|nr:acyl-CoA mutase large subunit family protein [Alistipes sp. OttesenSCG-928-B03]